MATHQIQIRRGTAAAWTSADPTLASGEIGFETDTGLFKWGDDTTAWTSLAYDKDQGVNTTDDVSFNSVSVAAGQKVMFEGAASDTYLFYNSSTSKLELYINGNKKADWG